MKLKDYKSGEATALMFFARWEAAPSSLRIRAIKRLATIARMKPTTDEMEFMEAIISWWDDDPEGKEEREKVLQQFRIRKGRISK
jgi:hypothetical protein